MFRKNKDSDKNKPAGGGHAPSGEGETPSSGLPGGARRSLLDDSQALRSDFAAVQERFDALLAGYAEHEFDQATLTMRLAELRVRTEDGAEWTLGAQTRLWYRRGSVDEPWLAATPPLAGVSLLPDVEETPEPELDLDALDAALAQAPTMSPDEDDLLAAELMGELDSGEEMELDADALDRLTATDGEDGWDAWGPDTKTPQDAELVSDPALAGEQELEGLDLDMAELEAAEAELDAQNAELDAAAAAESTGEEPGGWGTSAEAWNAETTSDASAEDAGALDWEALEGILTEEEEVAPEAEPATEEANWDTPLATQAEHEPTAEASAAPTSDTRPGSDQLTAALDSLNNLIETLRARQ